MSVAAPKVLILAGTDRLDRALTVGQMQGKFQLVLLPQVSISCIGLVQPCWHTALQWKCCALSTLADPMSVTRAAVLK